jgi:hypothetical protein
VVGEPAQTETAVDGVIEAVGKAFTVTKREAVEEQLFAVTVTV